MSHLRSRQHQCLSGCWCKCLPRGWVPLHDRYDTLLVDSKMALLQEVDGRQRVAVQDWREHFENPAWCEQHDESNVRLLQCFDHPLQASPNWSRLAHFDLCIVMCAVCFRKEGMEKWNFIVITFFNFTANEKRMSKAFNTHSPSFSKSLKSLSREIFLSSGLLSSCSRIAEFNSACSWSGSYSNALSKYANAWAGLFSSKNTTPNWYQVIFIRFIEEKKRKWKIVHEIHWKTSQNFSHFTLLSSMYHFYHLLGLKVISLWRKCSGKHTLFSRKKISYSNKQQQKISPREKRKKFFFFFP